MLRFLLNDQLIDADEPPGTTVLDFVRYRQHLTGTKTGCREGDCGACTVLVGVLCEGRLRYRSMTSCLMPLANAHGKHIVTIEGLNLPQNLNVVQQAMVEEGATQCGFCTVGFVVSLAGFCLNHQSPTYENGIAAIDGNICRCTGYKSIERAVERIHQALSDRPTEEAMNWLVERQFLPHYFRNITDRLTRLTTSLSGNGSVSKNGKSLSRNGASDGVIMGGGTDLYVQRPETLRHAAIQPVFGKNPENSIWREGNVCHIDAACTAEDLRSSAVLNELFPDLRAHMKLVSSTPIRNMGTVAGNLINASPIGDLTLWFLALDAQVTFRNGSGLRRSLPLRRLYLGYKTLDKAPDEIMESLRFTVPEPNEVFRFEKVCKRTYLDIATVNMASLIGTEDRLITKANIAVGGVAPIPLYLARTSAFLVGKPFAEATFAEADDLAQTEISPISDVRGSAEYKRLLVKQLLLCCNPESLRSGDPVRVC